MRRFLRGAVLAACASFAFVAPSVAAPTDDALKLVHERLKISPVLKGEFEQTKTLKGFKNPLVSKGEFLVARGQGVWWHTRQPFESTLVVTKTRLFTRNPDGSASNLMDAQAQPGLQQVSELIFSLLAADLDALAGKFDVVAQPNGSAGWTLTLTPRDANLAKFLVRATLAGDRDVQSVRIEESRGDTTQIRFSHQVPANAPTADETARFQ